MQKITIAPGNFRFLVYCLVLTVTVTSHPHRPRLTRDVAQQHHETAHQGNPDQYVTDGLTDEGEHLISQSQSHDHPTIQHQGDTDHRSSLLSDPDSAEQLENFDPENTDNAAGTLELGHNDPDEEIEQTDAAAELAHQVGSETEGDGENVPPDVEIDHQASQHGTGEGSVSHTDIEHIHGRRNIDDGDLMFSNGEVALHWTTRSTTVRVVDQAHQGHHVMIDSGSEIEHSSVAGTASSSGQQGQEIVDVGNVTHNAQLNNGDNEELAGNNDNNENQPGAHVSSTRSTPSLQIDHAEGNKARNQNSQGGAEQGPAYSSSSLTPEPSLDLPETTSNFPVIEPIIGTTAKLVILPTPAQSAGNESEHEGMITQVHPATTEESHSDETHEPESGTHETPFEGDQDHGHEEIPESHETELSTVTNSPVDAANHDEETRLSHVNQETTVHPEVIEGIVPTKGGGNKEPELKVSSSYVSVTPLYSSAAVSQQSFTEALPTKDRQGISSSDILHSSFSSPSTVLFTATATPTDSMGMFPSGEFIEQSMSFETISSFSSEFFEPTASYETSSTEILEPITNYRTSTDGSDLLPTNSDILMPEYSTELVDLEPTTRKMEIPDATQGPIIDQNSIVPSSMWSSENTYTSSLMFEGSSSSTTSNLHTIPSSTGTSRNYVITQEPFTQNVPTSTEITVTDSIEGGQEVTSALFTISKTDDYSRETTTTIPFPESATQETVSGRSEVPGHEHNISEAPVSTTQRTSLLPFLTVSMTTKRKKITQTPKVTDKTDAVVPTTRSGASPLFTPGATKQPVSQLPVYLQIQLRMSWHVFCDRKIHFIAKLREIIRTEKQVTVNEEQFHITNTQQCDEMPAPMMEPDEIDEMETTITVEMYIADQDGKVNIRLTIDASGVIERGFQNSPSFFKDKILGVQLHQRKKGSAPDTSRSTSPHNMSTGITMVIIIASVGGCCCVVLVILQLVMMHRRIQAKKMRPFISHRPSIQSLDHVALGVIPKSRPNSGYWNPSLEMHDELLENKKFSHLVNFFALANFCMDKTSIHEEFQSIPFETPGPGCVPIGDEDKNRFANVLPYKRTRVCLKKRPSDTSDYINANYITGYKQDQPAYIATQSPLVNTVEDFWRLVWEQQSRAILMLNPVMSTGKPKQSTCYWPDDFDYDSRREYGDFIVTLKKRQVHQDYIECTLEIMDIERNLKRELHHFWLTCWPDTGSLEPLTLVKFVLDTRPHYENSRASVIVHCGPGTGRTGTLVAVDTCMRMIEDKRCADILNRVFQMRGERAGAVQTKEQYSLIYQALNEYAVILSSPSISTRSSVITLHAML